MLIMWNEMDNDRKSKTVTSIEMKPEVVVVILRKILERTFDVWEHDALIHAINLELKEVRNNGEDSDVDI